MRVGVCQCADVGELKPFLPDVQGFFGGSRQQVLEFLKGDGSSCGLPFYRCGFLYQGSACNCGDLGIESLSLFKELASALFKLLDLFFLKSGYLGLEFLDIEVRESRAEVL